MIFQHTMIPHFEMTAGHVTSMNTWKTLLVLVEMGPAQMVVCVLLIVHFVMILHV